MAPERARPLTPLVARAAWHAAPAPARQPLARSVQQGVAVHYTAMEHDWVTSHRDCAQRVLDIQTYHVHHNGWADIAYNWLVCHHGWRFAGRGLGWRSAAQGQQRPSGVGEDRNHSSNRMRLGSCWSSTDPPGR